MKPMLGLQALPSWGVLLIVVTIVLISIELGARLGLMRRARAGDEPPAPIGSSVGAILGLLAFLLAFSFGTAATKYQTRTKLLLDDVNAISTAYRRAELLPAPHDEACRKLLRRYVDLRAQVATQPDDVEPLIAECEQIQDELWARAVAISKSGESPRVIGLFIGTLNTMFDLHTSRVSFGIHRRLPNVLWYALCVLFGIAMFAVGYQAGLAGLGNRLIRIVLATGFASVVFLVAEIDHPTLQGLRINQEPMLELQAQMNRTPPVLPTDADPKP